MPAYEGYPLMPETETEGFTYGAITPLGGRRESGAGFLQGPDGSRAGIQWELADGPFIMRVEGPGPDSWGLYKLGFTTPVTTVDDLLANLRPLLPKLKILYTRARVN